MSQDGDPSSSREPADQAAPTVIPGAPYSVSIRRDGCAVNICFVSQTEYLGIELYERLVQSAKQGHIRLEMGVPRS